MRTLVIAALAAAIAFGGTAADAQRLGKNSVPAGGWTRPSPMPMPAPQPQLPRPNPGNWNQPRPNPQPLPPQAQPPRPTNPGQWNNQPRPGNPGQWNNQPRPGNPGQWNNQPRPGNPGNGNWNNGGQNNGQWRGNGQYRGGNRWGGSVGGYWYAGVQAPGGWNGYKQIKRGKRIPSYWISSNFMIGDYGRYGLIAPPAGYYWTRYYNDALLIDRYGVVYDSRSGLDWDRYDAGYADDGYGYDDRVSEDSYYASEDDGPAYGALYAQPGGSTNYRYETRKAYPPAPLPAPRGPAVSTYYTGPGGTTTIVIPGATTTTTTTTYVEDTYVAKKVYRAPVRKWRPKPRRVCTCACGCR